METKTNKLTGMSILLALVIVLTAISGLIHFGPFSITLSLFAIIIGAAIYGPKCGAILGLSFGAVVLVQGLLGTDGGSTLYLISQNAFACIFTVLIKGTAAGFLAGLVYKIVEKKNDKLAVILSGIVCPVVNTGIFLLCMLTVYMDTLNMWANGQSVINFAIVTLTGVNFIIELVVNMVLASAMTFIIKSVGKKD